MSKRQALRPYNSDEIVQLKGIALPAKIKCGRCLKNLPEAKFSIKQLTDARWQIKNSGKMYKAINCQPCTGQQVVEVECTVCGKIKGLEEFAKSQRRNPDTARCFKCVEAQLDENPFDEDKYEDLDKAFVTPDHSNGQYPEYFSAATTDTSSAHGEDDWNSVNLNQRPGRKESGDGGVALSADFQRAMSLTGSTSEVLISSEYAYSAGNGKDNSDDWSEVNAKSWHTQSSRVLSTKSAFNPNAHGRAAPSAAGSSRSFASSVVEQSTTSQVRPNGWAKIPAAPRGPPIRPMGDDARETGPLVDAWGDSDDDEEEDDDDDDDYDSDDDTVI